MTRKGTHNPVIAAAIAAGLKLNSDGDIVLPSGEIHKAQTRSSRYARVTLRHGGKNIGVTRARMLCWLHYGPPPTDAHEADHINGDPRDDSPLNLRWATRSENTSNITPEQTEAKRALMRKRHADIKRKVDAHDDLVTSLNDLYTLIHDMGWTSPDDRYASITNAAAALAKAGA